MRNCVTLTMFLAYLFLGGNAQAASGANEAIDFTIHEHFVSARALGMGNAFVAVADDYAAMFYNPAGLAFMKDAEINLELRAMIDKDVIKFKNDLETASKSGNVADIQSFLESNYGKHYSSRLPTVGAYWVRPGGWGIAIIPADLSLELEIHQRIGPAANVVATQDTTVAYAIAHPLKWFGKHKFAAGLNVKGIYRGYFNRSINALDLAFDSNILRPSDANEGLTIDGDVGLMFAPDVSNSWMRALRPTLGMNIRNVADYGFSTNYHFIDPNTGKPPRLQRRLDVGTMFELPDFWIFKTRFAFDMRNIGHDNFTPMKGSHAGFEFLWKVFGWWRGGWRVGINEGYWTAGFTGKLAIFQLDLVTYGEEVGPSDNRKENRRYMAKASLDW